MFSTSNSKIFCAIVIDKLFIEINSQQSSLKSFILQSMIGG